MKILKLQFKVNPQMGLSESQVKEQPVNVEQENVSKSYGEIFKQHIFTFFNLVNFVLAALVLYTGSYRNMLFMIVVISNIVVGLVQEIRSKRVLEKLAILNQEKVCVIRDGRMEEIPADQVVLNDIIVLKAGNQIPVDGIVVENECEVNESMLTGESDPILKKDGDFLYAGCYLTAGTCRMQAAAVGDQTYMHSMFSEVRRSRRYPSALRDSLNKIIKICTWILVPLGLLLFARTYFGSHLSLNASILATVASMVGMIPEGLIILTSIALAAASVKLAKKNVLVQELYCVETLARVDVLCLDKTGTLTKGEMKVNELVCKEAENEQELKQVLANIYGSLEDDNATASAIRSYVKDIKPQWHSQQNFPFSSSAKSSGVSYEDANWYAGAYTFLEDNPDPKILDEINQYAKEGIRVLAVMKGPKANVLKKGHYELLGLVLIEDILRPDAAQTLEFFRKQGVQLKIISGDMPETVAAIAKQAGLTGPAINMQTVSDDQIGKTVDEYTIFGRVTPDQKRNMVEALKKQGHTVAMTGDGVNDVMALKEADCSIAMGSGSQAAKSIASLVLLKNQFEALPSILDEGRRVINNIQRTASLFLVKTLFSVGLTLLALFWLRSYPFQPIQLTLISALGVGIPSFVLTMEPNYARVSGNFLLNVLSQAIPGALSVITLVSLVKILSMFLPVDTAQFSTICTWLTGINALWVLQRVCVPFTPLRKILLAVMTAGFIGAMVFLGKIFMIVHLPWIWYILIAAAGILIPAYLAWLQSMNWKKNIKWLISTD